MRRGPRRHRSRQAPAASESHLAWDEDQLWIPRAADNGWIVISRDGHIKSRPFENQAIVDSDARFVTIDASKQPLNRWLQLEIIVCQWRRIEDLLEIPGPWIYTAGRTGLRKVLSVPIHRPGAEVELNGNDPLQSTGKPQASGADGTLSNLEWGEALAESYGRSVGST